MSVLREDTQLEGLGNDDSRRNPQRCRKPLSAVTDCEFNIARSGFAHELPLIAVGVVLISSIVLDPLIDSQFLEQLRVTSLQ